MYIQQLGCNNGATCINSFGNFNCTCTDEYDGEFCDTCKCSFISYINFVTSPGFSYISVVGGCYSSPCMNGAACIPVEPDSYSCQCPENLTLFGAQCNETKLHGFKYLIIDERQSWENAKTICNDLAYSLTSITSQDEMDFLSSFVG